MDSRKSESEDDLSLDLSFSSSDYDIEDSDNDNEVLGIQPYMFEPYSNEAPPVEPNDAQNHQAENTRLQSLQW